MWKFLAARYTLGFTDTANQYEFNRCNPILWLDPLGTYPGGWVPKEVEHVDDQGRPESDPSFMQPTGDPDAARAMVAAEDAYRAAAAEREKVLSQMRQRAADIFGGRPRYGGPGFTMQEAFEMATKEFQAEIDKATKNKAAAEKDRNEKKQQYERTKK
jgi:hypothetical protein